MQLLKLERKTYYGEDKSKSDEDACHRKIAERCWEKERDSNCRVTGKQNQKHEGEECTCVSFETWKIDKNIYSQTNSGSH